MINKLVEEIRKFLINRPHVAVIILIAITLIGFISGIRHYVDEARKQAAFDTAKTFQASISTLHQYYATVIVPRARAAGVEFQIDYDKTPDKLPFPATVSIEFGDALRVLNPILSTSLYSDKPFPNRQDRVLDPFETASLKFLKTNPAAEYYQIDTVNGHEIVRYAAAVIMKQVCADCHNRAEYGFEGKWKEGDVRGARQVSLPVPNIMPIVDQATTSAIILAIVASCLGGLLVWPVVGRLYSALQTSENLSAQLNDKNIELEAASQAKSDFLAAISHDLRSPMTAILGFSSLLGRDDKSRSLEEKAKTYASYIHESGTSLQALIDQLLEMSSIEAGHWTIAVNEIDLNDLLSTTLPPLENNLKDTGIRLSAGSAEGLPRLCADARALLRIINNLVENSAKYSEGSKIDVTFSQDNEGAILLTVADDGKGIAPARRGDAQQAGFQGDADSAQPSQGYGIGLWSVTLLAKMHDAVVEIDESVELGGCRVTVKFPVKRTITG